MAIHAGALDRRLLIEQNTGGVSSAGAPLETWATLATVWAGKRDISGREVFAAGQDMAEIASTRFIIRHRSDVTAAMRVTVDGVVYDITHIAEIGRREGLELLCVRRSAGG